MLAGELRAWLTGAFNFGTAHTQLVGNSILSTELTQADTITFTTASADMFNPGAENLTSNGMSALYPVFVDDTANTNTRSCILQTITASVLSAYVIFGLPSSDLWGNWPPCINENKWRTDLTHHMNYLGF